MDVKNTIGNARIGKSAGDATEADLERGYYDAGPEGDYQGSLLSSCDPDGMPSIYPGCDVRRQGNPFEADKYHETHDGELDGEYGFLRRPRHRGDVER